MTRFSTHTRSATLRHVAIGVIALAALAAAGCERALQVAPSSSVLVLSAPASTVPLSSSLTVTATLTDSTGAAVAEGTLVTFSSTLGTITPTESRISNGRTSVTLAAGSTSGVATITASSGGVSSNALSVRVGSVPARIVIASSTSGSVATISAVVFDAAGNSMPGTAVTFATTSGTLANSVSTTDAFGRATNTLVGTADAIVTATASGVSASVAIRFGFSGALSVNLSLSPNNPVRRQNVVFTATVTAPNNQAVFVQRYEWEFSDGVFMTTTGNQTARAYNNEGVFSVTVRVVTLEGVVGISRIEFYVD